VKSNVGWVMVVSLENCCVRALYTEKYAVQKVSSAAGLCGSDSHMSLIYNNIFLEDGGV
jgi:hypothetical protein